MVPLRYLSRGGGGYHLPGEVGVCGEEVFGKLVETAKPVLEMASKGQCVVVPPLPRYLYKGCCPEPAHCTNIASPSHPSRLLAATVKLRAVLKRKLGTGVGGKCWVLDTCCVVPEPDSKSQSDKLECLQHVSAKDGVHFTQDGYMNMSKNICETLVQLQAGLLGKYHAGSESAVSFVSGSSTRHFWRGFSSPVGSLTASRKPAWQKDIGAGHNRFKGPYHRKFPRWGSNVN